MMPDCSSDCLCGSDSCTGVFARCLSCERMGRDQNLTWSGWVERYEMTPAEEWPGLALCWLRISLRIQTATRCSRGEWKNTRGSSQGDVTDTEQVCRKTGQVFVDGVSRGLCAHVCSWTGEDSIAGGGPFGTALNRHAQTVWIAVRLIWELLSRSKWF